MVYFWNPINPCSKGKLFIPKIPNQQFLKHVATTITKIFMFGEGHDTGFSETLDVAFRPVVPKRTRPRGSNRPLKIVGIEKS